MERLLGRLESNGGWGQIIGPHGSGKSTLIATLLPELRRLGRTPYLVTIRDGQTRLARQPIPIGMQVVVVDGFEQLGPLGRAWMRFQCSWRKLGLIVTAHDSLGFPDLYRTDVTPVSAWQVVKQLSKQEQAGINSRMIADRLAAQDGNLREVLFELYDHIERSRKPNRQTGSLSNRR